MGAKIAGMTKMKSSNTVATVGNFRICKNKISN